MAAHLQISLILHIPTQFLPHTHHLQQDPRRCRKIKKNRPFLGTNVKIYIIALRTLAIARELKKCVEFFNLMNGFEYVYKVETFNIVVEFLCKKKLILEANHIVVKLKDWIKPDVTTYTWLIYDFCDVGNLIEASKVWNLMVDEGFKPDVNAIEVMLETLFKKNKFDDGFKIFHETRGKRIEYLGLSTYKLVIKWLCKKAKMGEARIMFDEMRMRGIKPDNEIFGSIVYGLLSRGRINEARKFLEDVENPDISLYHEMIRTLRIRTYLREMDFLHLVALVILVCLSEERRLMKLSKGDGLIKL
ncbi:pentatricopeptide repeat-containing family protein [Striga asiatica]|uniref:Pentatricopeptide repeat-containing family protein n=1 Tax=Striga asiatica TaxID=4170 RepID=A0A5A7QDE5_STRAF|nr:pentatricopeptide repeat-containing family protein [Striga asiatica]